MCSACLHLKAHARGEMYKYFKENLSNRAQGDFLTVWRSADRPTLQRPWHFYLTEPEENKTPLFPLQAIAIKHLTSVKSPET